MKITRDELEALKRALLSCQDAIKIAGQAVRMEQIALDLDKLETTATGKFIDAGFTNYVKLDDASLGMLDANLLE